jgi:hypothetical protein
LCYYAHDKKVENSIWKEQESKFWNGNIKELIKWATIDDTFSYPEFIRVTNIFHELFSSNANNGWTTDKVRQALITRRMPHYPDNEKFGYTSNEWKEIISKNSDDFLAFINCFHEKEKEEVLDEMRWNYPETPENLWAEFVQRDYLLKYCNTKHLYWNDKYGWLLVQNSWAKPISVKNMNLYHELLDIYNEVCEANQFKAKNNPAFRLARARFTENVFDRADRIFSTMTYDDINEFLNMFIKGKNINQVLMDVGILHKKPANTDNVIQFKKPEEK